MLPLWLCHVRHVWSEKGKYNFKPIFKLQDQSHCLCSSIKVVNWINFWDFILYVSCKYMRMHKNSWKYSTYNKFWLTVFCWTGRWCMVHPLKCPLRSWWLPPWLLRDHVLHHLVRQDQNTQADESATSAPRKHSPLHSHLWLRDAQRIRQAVGGWSEVVDRVWAIFLFYNPFFIQTEKIFNGRESHWIIRSTN